MTNEEVIQDALIQAIEKVIDARDERAGENDDIELAEIARELVDEFDGVTSVRSFEDAGLLTRNAGLVLRLESGEEFQITVVQSR